MGKLRSMQFRDRFNFGLLAIAVLLIMMTSLISVRSTSALTASMDRVRDTRAVRDALNEYRAAIGENEAIGLRYLISGRADYQSRFLQQLPTLESMLENVSRMTASNPLQGEHIVILRELSGLWHERVKTVLELKRVAMQSGSNIEVEAAIRNGKGADIIASIRTALSKMVREEERLLDIHIERRDSLVKQANATVLTANSLALVAGILGFVAIRRAHSESEKSFRVEIMAAQATRASEEKSAFLANMSHEIRTPMNAIFGFTQLLSNSVTAPIERDWVQAIKRSGQLLLNLINNVLDLSKIEAGKLSLDPQPADVSQLVQEAIELFLREATDKRISLSSQVDAEFLSHVQVDGPRLRQILMNLVSNAVKYTESGSVLVHVQMSPGTDERHRDLRLRVIDSGVGIVPEQRDRIFEPFHQADSPDGKTRQGTGLGLSITRRLVQLMHGSIRVESQLGQGSSFIVYIPQLPISDTPPAPTSTDDERIDFSRVPRLKILVVDDMAWNAQVAQGYLAGSHHSIFVANDGVEAVAAAKRIRPDVVLMDLRMPRMNGYEARDAIRADSALQTTAIIAVTASSLSGEAQALRASFDGYIRKPYSPIDLFAALEAIFGATARVDLAGPVVSNLASPPQNPSPQLQQRWQQLRTENLPELIRTMRMREIAGFALELNALGVELGWPRLIEHAADLGHSVRRFELFAVRKLLNDLAGWPEEFPHDQ